MRRYIITKELKEAIKKDKHTIRELTNLLGFDLKCILNKNISISENHWIKLKSFLNLNLDLKKVYFDYGNNLGEGYITISIKKVKITPDLAELIGIMLGDGNIHKNTSKIAFDKRNKKYLKYVEKLFYKIFGIRLKKTIYEKTNQAYLHCNNLYVVEELLKLGLKRGHKIKNQLGIPNWIKENKNYSKKCIRGLIDTDGCIYICKREKQRYVKFTNYNKKLLEDFKEVTKNLGYSFAKANKRNACLYRKVEVVKFIKDIQPLKATGL
jgi:hypothetical protein